MFLSLEDAGFFIDKREVSTAQYAECVMDGRCVAADRVVLTPQGVRIFGGDDTNTTVEQHEEVWGGKCNARRNAGDNPVNCVKFASAVDYCRWKDKRLPTSSEWTRAAAGTDGRPFPWGVSRPTCGKACYGLNGDCHKSQVASCAIGARAGDRTQEGIVDLAGNVAEWVQDTTPPRAGGGPPWRVLRGGSFVDNIDKVASATTRALPPVTAHASIGFRCAKDAPKGFAQPK